MIGAHGGMLKGVPSPCRITGRTSGALSERDEEIQIGWRIVEGKATIGEFDEAEVWELPPPARPNRVIPVPAPVGVSLTLSSIQLHPRVLERE